MKSVCALEIRVLYPSERITVFISIRRILSGNGGQSGQCYF